MTSRRSLSSPLLSQSSYSKQNSYERLKKSGDILLMKVFKAVAKIHKWDDWTVCFERFKSDGYEDLNQAQFARVDDLIYQYQIDRLIAIQLYLELQKEHRKQSNPNLQFFPTQEEIETISKDSLRNLHQSPAEIKYKSSNTKNEKLHLIILFGPQNSGKTTFISSCINFIREIEYHSLLRYTVQKDEQVVKIDGTEQYWFVKVQAITNPYDNRSLALDLKASLEDMIRNKKLQSFSIFYFAVSTQTRIRYDEKYQVQKILETVPLNLQNFFIIKTFCTSDQADMTIFTGEHSPAFKIPGFIDNYIKKCGSENGNKDKYIFNNKLLSYEYKNNNTKQVQQHRDSQNSIKWNQDDNKIRQHSQGSDQSSISNNQQQLKKLINQENNISQAQNQSNEEQSSQINNLFMNYRWIKSI